MNHLLTLHLLFFIFLTGCRPVTIPSSTALATSADVLPAGGQVNMPPTLALVGATLIDGSGATPLPQAVLVIDGGRIAAVGPADQVEIPSEAQVIDLQGATLLPGFINTHVHDAYNAENLTAWAQAGVTTVRDLSFRARTIAEVEVKFRFRDKILPRADYARIVASSPMMVVQDGYGSWYISSPDDARRQTELLLEAGADLIKIAFEDDLQGREWKVLSLAEGRTIVEAAHALGARVSAHVSRSVHTELALSAGVDDLAHMVVDDLPDAMITRLVQAGIYWVPTLELWKGVGWGAVPVENLRRFVEAGGKVALGTDFAGYTISFDLGMPIHEIEFMQEAGMTPMQIIVAATQNAAMVCQREVDLGSLEVGKIADVLVVNGDPLADLRALLNVRMVIKDGFIIRKE